MAKGHDRPGREAKKPKAKKTAAPASSTFLRPAGVDKPAPPRPAVAPPATGKS
jgi:hypothetical protein